jgi:hypothetical protein
MKYTLTITPASNSKNIELIKEIRDLTGWGLKECYELVTNQKPPFTVEVEDRFDSPFRHKQPERFLWVATTLLGMKVTMEPPKGTAPIKRPPKATMRGFECRAGRR